MTIVNITTYCLYFYSPNLFDFPLLRGIPDYHHRHLLLLQKWEVDMVANEYEVPNGPDHFCNDRQSLHHLHHQMEEDDGYFGWKCWNSQQN